MTPVGEGYIETNPERVSFIDTSAGGIGQAGPAPGPRRRPAGMPLIAAGIAVLLVALAFAIPSIRQAIFGPETEIAGPRPGPSAPTETPPPEEAPVQPPLQPSWQPVDRLVENRSDRDVVARREANSDSPPLETLSPGVIRPLVGVKGPVETAEISGVVWLRYPTQVEGVRGFLRANDLEPQRDMQ
jgi:hypothetical protein